VPRRTDASQKWLSHKKYSRAKGWQEKKQCLWAIKHNTRESSSSGISRFLTWKRNWWGIIWCRGQTWCVFTGLIWLRGRVWKTSLLTRNHWWRILRCRSFKDTLTIGFILKRIRDRTLQASYPAQQGWWKRQRECKGWSLTPCHQKHLRTTQTWDLWTPIAINARRPTSLTLKPPQWNNQKKK